MQDQIPDSQLEHSILILISLSSILLKESLNAGTVIHVFTSNNIAG